MDFRGVCLQTPRLKLNIHQGLTNKLQDSHAMQYHAVTGKKGGQFKYTHMESCPRHIKI